MFSIPPPVAPRYVPGVHQPSLPINPALVTTANEIPGMRHRFLGIVFGIGVREAGVLDSYKGRDALVGACEQTRMDALTMLIMRAAQLRANAVVGVKYETTILPAQGISYDKGRTEVCAYGTAAWVEP